MTPPTSPNRPNFDVAYETGFALSERARGLIGIHPLGGIDRKDRSNFTDRLSDTTTVAISDTDLV